MHVMKRLELERDDDIYEDVKNNFNTAKQELMSSNLIAA